DGRIERLVRATVHTHEAALFAATAAKLSPSTRQAMDALLDSSSPGKEAGPDNRPGWCSIGFSTLEGDPGRVSVKSVLHALEKLRQLEALQFPEDLFEVLSPKILRTYRLRVNERMAYTKSRLQGKTSLNPLPPGMSHARRAGRGVWSLRCASCA